MLTFIIIFVFIVFGLFVNIIVYENQSSKSITAVFPGIPMGRSVKLSNRVKFFACLEKLLLLVPYSLLLYWIVCMLWDIYNL